ncbi:MAG: metallophosphoesterase family protein [Planctomycetia bacterium]|nr:metallophosphoesterase family protein [Planctomycetia bacterium]
MKRAIFSDVHSNLEALKAVLEDIRQQEVDKDEIFCLGDVVGYGADPTECLDLVQSRCKVCLLGNHDQGALFDPEGFNGSAEKAIYWTREQLELPNPRRDERWNFLSERPRMYRDEENEMLFVHGSPRNPLNEYIFPEDVYNPRKLEAQFNLVTRFSFQGHTHVPGVFTEDCKFYAPEEFSYEKELPSNGKLLINVGSVGQPRDADPRACYVILEIEPPRILLTYRRVEYPIETAVEKIHAIPQLDDFLGDRLRVGR